MNAAYWEVERYDRDDQSWGYVVTRGYECPSVVNVSGGGSSNGNNSSLVPDFSLDPSFGSLELASGFLPDPYEVEIYVGGNIVASDAISACDAGQIAEAPDYRLHFDDTFTASLTIAAFSKIDSTLAINDPQGNWVCNDDFNDLNPSITFSGNVSGQYDIWIGSLSEADVNELAILSITER
jgi:hypothetical protein